MGPPRTLATMREKTSENGKAASDENRPETSGRTDARLRRIVRALARQLAREHQAESCKKTESDSDSER